MAMSGWCPVCNERWPIIATGEPIGGFNFSASWKKLVEHPDKSKTVTVGEIVVETRCEGSGKKI